MDAAGFFSYSHHDDDADDGAVTSLCKSLGKLVQAALGRPFALFLDRADIAWGEQWAERLDGAVDTATVLIPVVSPGYVASEWCRRELDRFLERERALGRSDLILPIYWRNVAGFDNDAQGPAAVVAAHQWIDFRELRYDLSSVEARRQLDHMAERIAGILTLTPPDPTPDSPGRVIVVDPLGRGDYEDLGVAVAAAAPGTRVLLRPGVYEHALVVDKPIELVGDGPRDEIVVEAHGANVITWTAKAGRIENLTIRQRGTGRFDAVRVRAGAVSLLRCDVSAGGECAVSVKRARADVHQCHLHHSTQSGIWMLAGRGTIEANEIVDNGFNGIEIVQGADPTVRKNQVHRNGQNGIFLYEGGASTVIENDICNNVLSGVEISGGADPVLRNNRINDNEQTGLSVSDGAVGTVENNEIAGNAGSGVEIKGGASPTIRHNRIFNNRNSGIHVHEQGKGLIEDNDVERNALNGIEVATGGDPTAVGNRVTGNAESGIYVYDNGLGRWEDNDIAGNLRNGVEVSTTADPRVLRNRVVANRCHGISVYDGGRGRFESNVVTGNGLGRRMAGIHLDGGLAITTGNEVSDNGAAGIVVTRRAKPVPD